MGTRCILLLALAATSVAAQDIKPFRAQDVQPVRPAQSIEPVRAQDAQRLPAPSPDQRRLTGESRGRDEPLPNPAHTQAGGAAALLGLWQTNIPGVVYTTPSSRRGYDVLHVSSGAAGGLLELNRDGTYKWNSYGGKHGRWVETGRSENPIEIIDTWENRRWDVRLEPKTGEIVLQSGSIWYLGRRAALK
jgi:hypothetical protein